MKNVAIAFLLVLSSLSVFGQHTLSLQVMSHTQKPIEYAKCELVKLGQGGGIPMFSNTNEEGWLTLENIGSGGYELTVSHPGYTSQKSSFNLSGDVFLNIELVPSIVVTDEVIVSSTRATSQSGTTFKTLSREDIEKQNFGQDLPFLLDQTPGVVVNSDAGMGVGYTGLRIRGSDPTRINVTINGIPYNDPESHGVFWVNLPDLASSANSLQIQRGVGTSTNGAGAFGATINMSTNSLRAKSYAEFDNSFGSFNTRKHTISAGTGLLKDRWAVDMRLSKIASDGWVNRATTDLQSYFFSGGYYGDKTILKLNIFGGKERTYQSWYGTPEAVAKEDEAGITAYADRNFIFGAERDRLFDEGRQYNFYTYDNEVDNYQQDHYQLHLAHQINSKLNLTGALHYTYGRGYFEQFRAEDDFADYPLVFGINELEVAGDTISGTDLIRRRWLENHFYGLTWSLNYRPSRKVDFAFGGAANRYDGDHFGEVIWAEFAPNSDIRDRYYDNRALKDDVNAFVKGNVALGDKLTAYIDLQYRNVYYQWGDSSLNSPGIDADQRPIQGEARYHFFNPKAGLTMKLNQASQLYASFAIGNREPVRSDFIDAPEGQTPSNETLHNLELGYRFKGKKLSLQANAYWMDYDNQLVATGELNDVGAIVRTNVKDSYRAGVEIDGSYSFTQDLHLGANLALSDNRIKNFNETVYQYGSDGSFGVKVNEFSNTYISFSPAVITGASLVWEPVKGGELAVINKYVGRQYLDNTSNPDRSLDPYYVAQFRASYGWKPSWAQEIRLSFQLNNLFDARYSPNGYTYNYEYDDVLIVENFLYPQAGRHVMGAVSLSF